MEPKKILSYKQGFTEFTIRDSKWRYGHLTADENYLFGDGARIAVKSKLDRKTYYINKNIQLEKAESIKKDFIKFLIENKYQAIPSFMGNFNDEHI